MDRSAQSCNTKKPWTVEEDDCLRKLVLAHGSLNWTSIGGMLTDRSGKQCRERWHNHLNPDIKKGEWSEEEDMLILSMQRSIGNQWAKITKYLPGRSDNAIKNRFHAIIRARSSQIPTQMEQAYPVMMTPPTATAIKLENWGCGADGVADKKLAAETSTFGFPVLSEGFSLGMQALQSIAPVFGGFSPSSDLQPMNQAPASRYPQIITAPQISGFASFSGEGFASLSSIPVETSSSSSSSSPAPSLKSLSPMTVDEEFLDYWMSGSKDEYDGSNYNDMIENVSVCSDVDDFEAMLVEEDICAQPVVDVASINMHYQKSGYSQQQYQQHKLQSFTVSAPHSVGWEFGF